MTKLGFSDGFARINLVRWPKGSIKTIPISTTHIRMDNVFNNATLIDNELASSFTDESGTPIGDQDAVMAYVDANFKSATSGGETGSGSTSIAYTTAIPFDHTTTIIAAHTVAADIVLTKVTAGAVAGNGAILRLTADGTHTVDLSAFKLIGSGAWVNTNATVNQLMFLFDGVDYCVVISQPVAIAAPSPSLPIPAAPTSGVVDDSADTFSCAENPTYPVASHTYEKTLDGGITFADYVGTTSPLSISVGNVAKNVNTVGIRVKAVSGVNNAGTTLYNSTAFTVSGGLDSDATAYIGAVNTALGTTMSSPNQSALQTLFGSLKAVSSGAVYSDLVFWLPVWGTASADKFNAANPVDTDGAHRLSWNGTFNHAATGVTPVISSTPYALCHFNFLDDVAAEDFAAGFYTRTASTGSNRMPMGAGGSMLFSMDYNGNAYAPDGAAGTSPSTTGTYTFSRTSTTTSKVYVGGSLAHTFTSTYVHSGYPNNELTLGSAVNAGFFSDGEYPLFWVCKHGLTGSEVTAIETAFVTFLTAIGAN